MFLRRLSKCFVLAVGFSVVGFNPMCFFSPVFASHSYNGSYEGCTMSGGSCDISFEKISIDDSKFTFFKELKIQSTTGFSGNGYLQAPSIDIVAETFDFTGTIKCDGKCVITVKHEFDPKMFTWTGSGELVVVVDPDCYLFAEPHMCVKYELSNICFTFHYQVYAHMADAIISGNLAALKKSIEKEMGKRSHSALENKEILSGLMHLAGLCSRLNMVKKFIELGVDIHGTEEYGAAIGIAIERQEIDYLRLLIACGFDVSYRFDQGFTALMGAAVSGFAQGVKILLAAGADKSLKDDDGQTARDYAIAEGHEEVAKLLL